MAATDRGKEVIVSRTDTFAVGDHDFTKFSLILSCCLLSLFWKLKSLTNLKALGIRVRFCRPERCCISALQPSAACH